MELLKDHDCNILYHPGKGNVVTDALSRYPQVRGSRLMVLDLEMLSQHCDWKLEFVEWSVYSLTLSKKLVPDMVSEIMRLQFDDPKLR